MPARKTLFQDIALVAVPAKGNIATNQIFDLSNKLSADGKLDWDAPAGDWVIYRFGHTTMGSMLQPCQWEAIGLQVDMMRRWRSIWITLSAPSKNTPAILLVRV